MGARRGEQGPDQYGVQLLREKKSGIGMVILQEQQPLCAAEHLSAFATVYISFLFIKKRKDENFHLRPFKRLWQPLSCQFGRDRGKSLRTEPTSFEGWWLAANRQGCCFSDDHISSAHHRATCICDTGNAGGNLA